MNYQYLLFDTEDLHVQGSYPGLQKLFFLFIRKCSIVVVAIILL
jgi:hypothetical protein